MPLTSDLDFLPREALMKELIQPAIDEGLIDGLSDE
jgi:hypothetical protein